MPSLTFLEHLPNFQQDSDASVPALQRTHARARLLSPDLP